MDIFAIHLGKNSRGILRFGEMYLPFRYLTLKNRQPLNLGLCSKQVPPHERISNQVKFSPGNLEI